jgi:hypothetical protein
MELAPIIGTTMRTFSWPDQGSAFRLASNRKSTPKFEQRRYKHTQKGSDTRTGYQIRAKPLNECSQAFYAQNSLASCSHKNGGGRTRSCLFWSSFDINGRIMHTSFYRHARISDDSKANYTVINLTWMGSQIMAMQIDYGYRDRVHHKLSLRGFPRFRVQGAHGLDFRV